VDQVVALWHILRNAESIDEAVNELPVRHWLTEIIQLRANSVEVVEVASQSVAGLDGAVQLRLQGLDVVQRVVLIGIRQG
jgi:hypothetical protein